MQNKILTGRAYLLGAALLAFFTALLRTLALTLSFDRASGYFTSGALPLLYRIIAILSLVAIVTIPPIFLRGKISPTRASLSRIGTCGALLTSLLLFMNFIVGCTIRSTILSPLLWLMGLLSLLLSTVYFLLQTPRLAAGTSTHAILGSFAILALACLIAFTYFDITTPMNAPRKMDLHMALLAVILYLLYELRAKTDISHPTALSVFGGLAFFLTVSVGLSDIIAYLIGVFGNPLYLVQDLLLLTLAVYIGARSFADATLSQNTTGKDHTV